MKKFLDLIDQGDYDHDYKSDLQEMVQKHGDVNISYVVTKDEGPAHDKTIWMEIHINGKVMGESVGKKQPSGLPKKPSEGFSLVKPYDRKQGLRKMINHFSQTLFLFFQIRHSF